MEVGKRNEQWNRKLNPQRDGLRANNRFGMQARNRPTRKLMIENRSGLVRYGLVLNSGSTGNCLYAFVVRELKVRYKQTAIGVSLGVAAAIGDDADFYRDFRTAGQNAFGWCVVSSVRVDCAAYHGPIFPKRLPVQVGLLSAMRIWSASLFSADTCFLSQ